MDTDSKEEEKKYKQLTNALYNSETNMLEMLRKMRAMEIICRTFVDNDTFEKLLGYNLVVDKDWKEQESKHSNKQPPIDQQSLDWSKDMVSNHYNKLAAEFLKEAQKGKADTNTSNKVTEEDSAKSQGINPVKVEVADKDEPKENV